MNILELCIVSIFMFFFVQKIIINHIWWTPIITFIIVCAIYPPFEEVNEDTYQPDLSQPYIIP